MRHACDAPVLYIYMETIIAFLFFLLSIYLFLRHLFRFLRRRHSHRLRQQLNGEIAIQAFVFFLNGETFDVLILDTVRAVIDHDE